ncbi:unnamed protein product [Onchocerca ochengi]|uniref:Uncharacterized protein n=1 Tax=Onchocerca ochengi TaxID=42157 RepID=A0A182ERH4_ONCOC|nr:unnamed protein product [Onchocerca ochengi]
MIRLHQRLAIRKVLEKNENPAKSIYAGTKRLQPILKLSIKCNCVTQEKEMGERKQRNGGKARDGGYEKKRKWEMEVQKYKMKRSISWFNSD